MVGWHHWLNGHEFEQALGFGEGQGGLACCSPWGRIVGPDLVSEQQQHLQWEGEGLINDPEESELICPRLSGQWSQRAGVKDSPACFPRAVLLKPQLLQSWWAPPALCFLLPDSSIPPQAESQSWWAPHRCCRKWFHGLYDELTSALGGLSVHSANLTPGAPGLSEMPCILIHGFRVRFQTWKSGVEMSTFPSRRASYLGAVWGALPW